MHATVICAQLLDQHVEVDQRGPAAHRMRAVDVEGDAFGAHVVEGVEQGDLRFERSPQRGKDSSDSIRWQGCALAASCHPASPGARCSAACSRPGAPTPEPAFSQGSKERFDMATENTSTTQAPLFSRPARSWRSVLWRSAAKPIPILGCMLSKRMLSGSRHGATPAILAARPSPYSSSAFSRRGSTSPLVSVPSIPAPLRAALIRPMSRGEGISTNEAAVGRPQRKQASEEPTWLRRVLFSSPAIGLLRRRRYL